MKISTPFLAVLIIVISCNFDEEVGRSLENRLLEISEKQNPIQEFTISTNRDTVIIGDNGTKVFFEANSLENKAGKLAQSEIEITLKEIYTNSEMVLNGLSTTSKGNLLETSGMINLTAKSDEQLLSLKEGASIKIQFKKISDSRSMRTYLKSDDMKENWVLDTANIYDTIRIIKTTQIVIELAYGADSVINYQEEIGIIGTDTILLGSNKPEMIISDEALDSTAGISRLPDYQLPFYEITSTKLNWINCDYFRETNDNVQVLVSPSDSLGYSQTHMIFKEYNSIMTAWMFENDNQIFMNVPIGSEVTIFSMLEKDSKLFYSISNHTIGSTDKEIELHFKETTLDKLAKIIQKLD